MDAIPNRLSLRLGFRVFRDALRFSGRATRTEVVAYWLVCALLGILLSLFGSTIARPVLQNPQAEDITRIFQLVTWLPMPALLFRRVHDQGHGGWLILALFALELAAVCGFWAYAAAHPGSGVTVQWLSVNVSNPDWTLALAALCLLLAGAIASYVWMCLGSPTPGANRYGPDPRDGEQEAVSYPA